MVENANVEKGQLDDFQTLCHLTVFENRQKYCLSLAML